MSYAYANAGTFVRPYYMDPNCPDYLKPAQWTQGGCAPYGSIFNGGYGYPQAPMMGPAPMPMDGCDPYAADDGKISFGQKASSFVKGIFRPITNMFSSPGNFLKGALCIAGGAALIAVTGGAATPLLVAAGVVGGGLKIAKGAINASNAQTDAEAMAAWEDMGEGTGVVAASVAGSKAALKKAGVNTDGMTYLQATKKCFTGAKGFAKTSWTTASTKVSALFAKKPATTTTTNTTTTKVNADIETKAKARTQAELDAQRQAELSQEAYKQSFEKNLSNKSAQNSAYDIEAQLRTQEQAQAVQAAKAAQAKYNKPFEDALSNKSAQDSASVFSQYPDTPQFSADSVIHQAGRKLTTPTTELPRVSYTEGLKTVKTGSAKGGAYYHDWRNGTGTYKAYKANKY